LDVILDKYVKASTEGIEVIRKAIAEGDAEALFQAAHALKSSSGMVGALPLAEMIKELEALGQSGDLSLASDLFARAEREFHAVQHAIKMVLSKKAA